MQRRTTVGRVGAAVLSALVIAGGVREAAAQAAMPAGGSSGAAFNPFANPYTNPYINPLATEQPLDRTTNALYLLAAGRYYKQRAEQEDARRAVAGAQDRRRPATPAARRPAFNASPPDRFGGGTPAAYFGRRGSYYPN